jgi:hypothetical protein
MDFETHWIKVGEDEKVTPFNFLLTNFIYPLNEPITLSKQFDYVLDNPRTPEEISYLLEALSMKPLSASEPITEKITHFKKCVEYFRQVVSPIDDYVATYLADYDENNAIEQIVKMLIIFRYKSDRNAEHIKKQNRLSIQNLQINGEEIDGEGFVEELNRENAIKFSHVLSLLIHKRGHYFEGDSFLVENPNNYYWPKNTKDKLEDVISTWLYSIRHIKQYLQKSTDLTNIESHDWCIFSIYKENLISACSGIENLFTAGREEQFFYIGELVRQAQEINDEKSKLISLVSAIELLLTRNPDQSRFNVEDSITKQFVLKSAVLIYKNDKSKTIEELGARLKEIYTQRSNIAHGNFKELAKFIQSINKRQADEKSFISLVEDCFWYLRLIMREYGSDMAYIDFLKKQ